MREAGVYHLQRTLVEVVCVETEMNTRLDVVMDY